MKRLNTTIWKEGEPIGMHQYIPTKDMVIDAISNYSKEHTTIFVECDKTEYYTDLSKIAGIVNNIEWDEESHGINSIITILDTPYGTSVSSIIDSGNVNAVSFIPLVTTTPEGADGPDVTGIVIDGFIIDINRN